MDTSRFSKRRKPKLPTIVSERIGPIPEHDPMIGQLCYGCGQLFTAQEYFVRVMLGPGGDREQRKRCRDGLDYNAVSLALHFACATGIEDDRYGMSRLYYPEG